MCGRRVTFGSRTLGGSAQEGLAALPVADHVDGVQIARVAGRVEDPMAAGGRALPGPPPSLLVERRRLGADLVAEALVRLHRGADARRAVALGLARVRVVLADVRGHGRAPDRSSRSRRWKTGDGFV